MALETIAFFRTPGTLSAWPYWKSPTARWEDKMDMTELFRELLAMTGREKEATITANTMLHGLHRHGLHNFCNPKPPLIDQTTFTKLACDELEKMKMKPYETKAISLKPTTTITKLQSSPAEDPSGHPTPIGVGGPTPPLVSRGSEEDWKMRIPTGMKGGGVQHLPHRGEGGCLPPPQGEA